MVSACASVWVGGNDRDWMVPESMVHQQSWVAIGLEHLSRMVVFPGQSGGTSDLPGSGPQAFDDA